MRLRPLRFPDCKRPFWLLVALAVAVLLNVSTNAAPERSVASLLTLLGRDLGALRVHVEELMTESASPAPPMVAFNADVGDGSPAFRARTMTTLMRSAHRRVTRLIRVYAKDGDDDGARIAQMLKIRLHELEHRIDRLVAAEHRAPLHNAHMQVRTALDRIELDLAALSRVPGASSVDNTDGERATQPDAALVRSGSSFEN